MSNDTRNKHNRGINFNSLFLLDSLEFLHSKTLSCPNCMATEMLAKDPELLSGVRHLQEAVTFGRSITFRRGDITFGYSAVAVTFQGPLLSKLYSIYNILFVYMNFQNVCNIYFLL